MRIKGSDLKKIIKEEISRMNESRDRGTMWDPDPQAQIYKQPSIEDFGGRDTWQEADPGERAPRASRTRTRTPMKGVGPTWGEGRQGLVPKMFDEEVDNKFRLGGEFLKELLGSVVSGGAKFGSYKIERPAYYNDWRATVTVTTEEGAVGTAQSARFGGYFDAISKAIDETEGVDPEFLSSEYEP